MVRLPRNTRKGPRIAWNIAYLELIVSAGGGASIRYFGILLLHPAALPEMVVVPTGLVTVLIDKSEANAQHARKRGITRNSEIISNTRDSGKSREGRKQDITR